MKILFATYPTAFHTPGGGEIQLLAYKKELINSGIKVSLFNPWKPNFNSYDLVHFFSCIDGSSVFCSFIKQMGIPLVISSSLWLTKKNKDQFMIDSIRHQLSMADKIITNSEIESTTLSDILSIPIHNFSHVYNGVDLSFFGESKLNLFKNKFKIYDKYILNVANIEPRKNQLSLVKAIKKFPHLKLVLIGHLRDSDYFSKIVELGGDQVIYIGPLKPNSALLRSAYAGCDVFALPSILETPGLAAIEAAAMNKPVVITSEGSTLEYFKDYVFYIDPLSLTSLEFAIASALSSSNIKSKFFIKDNYKWSKTTAKLINIYKDLLV